MEAEMEQTTIPQTVGYPISNTAAILDFTDGVLPEPPYSFFPHDQVNHNLTIVETVTYPENRAAQRILDNYRFREVLENDSPALLKLNVRNLPTTPLSIISATLAKTIPKATRFPVLAFFCDNDSTSDSESDSDSDNSDSGNDSSNRDPLNPPPLALTITTTLTAQLMLFLATHDPKIDLTGTMLKAPNGAYFRAKNNLNDSLELLSTLLLSLPFGETAFIIIDNVGQLDPESEVDLVFALTRIIELTRRHITIKVVITGTRGEFSDRLDEYFREADMYTPICTVVGHSFRGDAFELDEAFDTVKLLIRGFI